jgi:enoyl-CoA hydratase/carnithine racemase
MRNTESMNDHCVERTRDGSVAVLTLSAPQARNAFDDAMILELVAALRDCDADAEVGCIVMTGDAAGKAFCAGGNLRDMALKSSPMFSGAAIDTHAAYRQLVQQIPLAFDEIETPVIAAINGAAIGAGCDIAAMCDIRLASDHARFASSFVRVGLISGDGGAWYLPRAIGWARAIEMSLTGDMIDAETALEFGLVSKIIAADRLMEEAISMAARIASQPRHAVRLTKRLFRQSQGISLRQSLDAAAALQSIVQQTDDHRESVMALLEIRPARLTGK